MTARACDAFDARWAALGYADDDDDDDDFGGDEGTRLDDAIAADRAGLAIGEEYPGSRHWVRDHSADPPPSLPDDALERLGPPTSIDVNGRPVPHFTSDQVALALSRAPRTIRDWYKRGWLVGSRRHGRTRV